MKYINLVKRRHSKPLLTIKNASKLPETEGFSYIIRNASHKFLAHLERVWTIKEVYEIYCKLNLRRFVKKIYISGGTFLRLHCTVH
jgi:hypothetical protein